MFREGTSLFKIALTNREIDIDTEAGSAVAREIKLYTSAIIR